MAKTIKLPAKPGPFRKWLEGKKPHEIVGVKNTPFRCPIAEYMTNAGFKNPSVGCSSYRDSSIQPPWNRKITPKWAAKFIGLADKGKVFNITARRALKILDEVENGT